MADVWFPPTIRHTSPGPDGARTVGRVRGFLPLPAFEAAIFRLARCLRGALVVIARIWHGITLATTAADYLVFLRERAVPDYRAVPGNLSAQLLHRIEGRLAHFVLISQWHSRQAIEAFAGADIEKAKYYPQDMDFLIEHEPTVCHYQVDPAPPLRAS